MLRKFGWLVIAIAFQCCPLEGKPLKVKVQSDGAILMNADTGAILYQKNAKKIYYPASITKVATALYTLKVQGDNIDTLVSADQDAVVSVTEEEKKRSNYTLAPYWLEPGSTHIGIKKGETISLRALLYGMLVASGNDASNVLAQYVGGTIPSFMENLNAYLKEIGCEQTTFYNPHGLHHPNHQTTAYDMAIITQEALKYPIFREIVSTVRYTRPKTNKQESTTLIQTNKLLRSGKLHYSKAIGVKTGYTSAAQNTFIAAAKQPDGRTLIAVLLHCKERNDMFKDATLLFETAFSEKKIDRVLLKSGEQRFTFDLPDANKPIKTYLPENAVISYFPAEEPAYKTLLYWEPLSLPVKKDQLVAKLDLTAPDGSVLKSIPLFAMEDVKTSWTVTAKAVFFWILKIGAVAVVVFLIFRLFRRS